ncbi:MAG: arginyltransferase [Gammaproteobacteria bacterium]|nr:arginyltransferase [Gammaproteobacteria bacterium]
MTSHHKQPEIFLSMPHACSYLSGRTATSLFLDPRQPLDSRQYAGFMRLGFRRSGDLVYRPHCHDCNACIPVRIPVNRFRPDRAQRRVWKRNQDISVIAQPPVFQQGHFELYQRYQAARHPGGGMDDPDPQKYMNFLGSRNIDSVFYELRHRQSLLGIAVTDILPDGLSAVYTFFDPDEYHRSLGVYAVLWQVNQAQERQLPWLYLGYWIKECPKMSYKGRYQPLEAFVQGRWINLEKLRAHSAP